MRSLNAGRRAVAAVVVVACAFLGMAAYEATRVVNADGDLRQSRSDRSTAERLGLRVDLLENVATENWALTGRFLIDAQRARDALALADEVATFYGRRAAEGGPAEAAIARDQLGSAEEGRVLVAAAVQGPEGEEAQALAARMILFSTQRTQLREQWLALNTKRIEGAEGQLRRHGVQLLGLMVLGLLAALGLVAAARRRAGHERERTMTRLRQTAAEMAELASTDPLTGLRNQREFYARLDRELYEMQDDERPLALALLDVDDFKQINDKRGHLIGDQVLIEIARRVEHQAVACGGFSARVGGEEFAVVLPPRASEESRSIAESLRSAIEPPIIPVGLVTVSVGLAHARSNDDAIALFRRADRALYAAKRAGKNCVQVAEDALSLFDELNEGKASGSDAYDALSSLVSSVDRSQAMEGHSQRVARFAASLARRVGWGPDQVARIRQAALLHDVGKVTVPSGILAKPGRLTEGESSLVSAHPEVGSEMVRRALDPEQASWVLHHHERWDGVGYPDGLVGEEIPEGARILAIADAWDAMTSDRVYAPALDAEAAVAELNACKGTQFWPRGVELMVALAGEPSREQAPA